MKITKIQKLAITGGIILDGTRDMQPRTGQVILIDRDLITDILPEETWQKHPNRKVYREYDLRGKYIMPGLINMHVHLAGNGKPQKKQRDNEALVKLIMSTAPSRAIAYRMVCGFARLELLSGVTTIRTVGGLADFDSRCRDAIAAGKVLGSRILAANEGISVPDGHMAGSVAIRAETIEAALEQVDRAKEQKADLIKLMITGGVLDAREKGVPGELKMHSQMVRAVCDKAHAMGFTVAAHVESPQGVLVALQNGVDSIEHGAQPDAEILRLFKENNAFLCTTLSPALPYALFDRSISHASEVEQFNGNVVFEGIIACAKAALEQGIPIALGNDVGCPYITQYDFWRELFYFHKYVGVSNAFALHTATEGNAILAGIVDKTGSIAEGKCADLIVTSGNPLEDLRHLRTLDCVISGGRQIIQPEFKRNSIVDQALDPYLA